MQQLKTFVVGFSNNQERKIDAATKEEALVLADRIGQLAHGLIALYIYEYKNPFDL